MSEAGNLVRLRAEYADRERRLAGSDIYSLFNPGHLFIVQQRQRAMLSLLRRQGFYPLAGRRILEVGCGTGQVLRELRSYGARPKDLHGAELLDWRVAEAHALSPNFPLTCADGQHLPYPDATFGLVLQFTVFTSILDDRVKATIAQEMLRVLKPDGMILWYDYWLNPVNRAVQGVRPAEIRRLFPSCRCEFQRITLAPPIARSLGGRSWLLCCLLEGLRVFNTHYLVAIKKSVGE